MLSNRALTPFCRFSQICRLRPKSSCLSTACTSHTAALSLLMLLLIHWLPKQDHIHGATQSFMHLTLYLDQGGDMCWMNESKSEWLNIWMNERVIAWVNEQMDEWMNDWLNESVSWVRVQAMLVSESPGLMQCTMLSTTNQVWRAFSFMWSWAMLTLFCADCVWPIQLICRVQFFTLCLDADGGFQWAGKRSSQ